MVARCGQFNLPPPNPGRIRVNYHFILSLPILHAGVEPGVGGNLQVDGWVGGLVGREVALELPVQLRLLTLDVQEDDL